jgi:hypothetical protein
MAGSIAWDIRPRRSATHWASTMSEAGIVEDPIARTLPPRPVLVTTEVGRSVTAGGCLRGLAILLRWIGWRHGPADAVETRSPRVPTGRSAYHDRRWLLCITGEESPPRAVAVTSLIPRSLAQDSVPKGVR